MANITGLTKDNDPGMLIFEDVFRRADKNDVGAVSWENFMSFFADGVVGKDELLELFDEIDTHNTNNIDCGELCSYFSKHLGPFHEIYTKVEELNRIVGDALLRTSKAYPEISRQDKFVTRFLLREMLNQFSSLQRPLEAASETLDEQAKQERPDVEPLGLETGLKKNPSSVIPGRVVRRAKRQVSSQSSTSDSPGLTAQVDRLEALLDRFENKVNFDGITDEEIIEDESSEDEDQVILVKRTLSLKPGVETEFRPGLKGYVINAQQRDGCLYVSVRYNKSSSTYKLYEIWNSEDELRGFESGGTVAMLTALDHAPLVEATDTTTMAIPGTWWKK